MTDQDTECFRCRAPLGQPTQLGEVVRVGYVFVNAVDRFVAAEVGGHGMHLTLCWPCQEGLIAWLYEERLKGTGGQP